MVDLEGWWVYIHVHEESEAKLSKSSHSNPPTTRHDTRTQAAHRHDDIKYNRFFPTLHQPRKEKIFFFLCECFNSCSPRRWRCEVVFPCLECWLENQSAESWISCVADRAEGGMRLTPPSKREREKKSTFYVFSAAGVRYMNVSRISSYHAVSRHDIMCSQSFFIKGKFSAALAMIIS